MAALTAYLLLATIMGCLVMPGVLFISAWAPKRPTPLQLLIWVLPVGIVFFAILGAVSAIVASLGSASWRLAGVCTYVGLLLPAAIKLGRRRSRPVLWGSGEHARLARVAWLTFVLIIALCFTLAIQNVSNPWEMQFYRDISSTKTFGTYPTHDNYFQFVNGAAIADGEPFSKYYGDGRLVYPVTSREVFPGLTYAGLRFLLRAVGSGVERSFLSYLQFGLIQNASLVLGLAALIASCGLRGRVFGLVALALWSSPYALLNMYFTWFKFAGAGLALLAVAALLAERYPTTRHYALAGTLFGLSTNMHTGNALALPFLAWPAVRRIPWDRWRCAQELRKFAVAASCLMMTLVPWMIIKGLWFDPDKILFRQHYINHMGADNDSTWTLIQFLFTQWTPEQHLAHRVGNLVTTLRLPEWLEVARASGDEALVLWMQFRITYVGFVLAPIAAAATLRVGRRPVNTPALRSLGICSLVGIGVLLLAHFSTFYADMTAHLPASLIAISYAWLVFLATDGGRRKMIILMLACFSVLECGLASAMLIKQMGQTQFAQNRTVMPEQALFSYVHYDMRGPDGLSAPAAPRRVSAWEGKLVQSDDDPKIYLIEKSKKRWIKSPAALQKHAFRWEAVNQVKSAELAVVPEGAPIE